MKLKYKLSDASYNKHYEFADKHTDPFAVMAERLIYEVAFIRGFHEARRLADELAMSRARSMGKKLRLMAYGILAELAVAVSELGEEKAGD